MIRSCVCGSLPCSVYGHASPSRFDGLCVRVLGSYRIVSIDVVFQHIEGRIIFRGDEVRGSELLSHRIVGDGVSLAVGSGIDAVDDP